MTDKGRKIYSLRAQHLIDIIKTQQQIIDNSQEPVLKNIQRNALSIGVQSKKSNNILDKLKEIDNDDDSR